MAHACVSLHAPSHMLQAVPFFLNWYPTLFIHFLRGMLYISFFYFTLQYYIGFAIH